MPRSSTRSRARRGTATALLQKPNPGQILRDLMALRDPLYREIADVVVETDERPPRLVVQEILERLRKLPPR